MRKKFFFIFIFFLFFSLIATDAGKSETAWLYCIVVHSGTHSKRDACVTLCKQLGFRAKLDNVDACLLVMSFLFHNFGFVFIYYLSYFFHISKIVALCTAIKQEGEPDGCKLTDSPLHEEPKATNHKRTLSDKHHYE